MSQALESWRGAATTAVQRSRRTDFQTTGIGVPPVDELAGAAALFHSLGHPLRLQIVLALERDTVSPTERAQQLDAALGVIAYHVRTLRAAGIVELDHTRPVRGSMQSFYRLAARGHTALRLLALARAD